MASPSSNTNPIITWTSAGEVDSKKGHDYKKRSEYVAEVSIGDKKYTVTVRHHLGENAKNQKAIKEIVEEILNGCNENQMTKMAGHKFKTDLKDPFDASNIQWANINKPAGEKRKYNTNLEEELEQASQKVERLFERIHQFKSGTSPQPARKKESTPSASSSGLRLEDEPKSDRYPASMRVSENANGHIAASGNQPPNIEDDEDDEDTGPISFTLQDVASSSSKKPNLFQRAKNLATGKPARKKDRSPATQSPQHTSKQNFSLEVGALNKYEGDGPFIEPAIDPETRKRWEIEQERLAREQEKYFNSRQSPPRIDE